MAEFKKIIQCPSCRFANRVGEKRCIICKHELPEGLAAAASPPAGVGTPAPGATPRPGEKKRVGGVAQILVDPLAKKPIAPDAAKGPHHAASNAAANARAAAAKAPGAHSPIEGRVTAAVTRPPLPAADGLAKAAAPKPLTSRVVKPGANTIAWLVCEPLSPIPLGGQREVTVGRHEKCDLVLPHKEVSRHHASFKVSGRQITLEDEGSSNGCYVNGKRCASQIVKVGDLIQIGPYELELRASAAGSSELQDETKTFDLTSLAKSTRGASMTGKLEDVPLREVLQTIEFNEKTCTIAITSGGVKGQAVFADGRPITATFGTERDVAALRAMLRLKAGRFVVSNEVQPAETTIQMTITAVLLDASREIDESERPESVTAAHAPIAVAAEPTTASAPASASDPPATDDTAPEAVAPEPASEPAALDAGAPEPASEAADAEAGASALTSDAGALAESTADPEPAARPHPGDMPTELSVPTVSEATLAAYEQAEAGEAGEAPAGEAPGAGDGSSAPASPLDGGSDPARAESP